jgi:hypothetical protein
VTFTGAVPGNDKPERYFMDKSGNFAIRLNFHTNPALYIYVRIKGSGVWRRIDFAAPWTPPTSSTACAYGSGTRGIWQNGNDLNLRVGDVNRDGKLKQGGAADSGEQYILDREDSSVEAVQAGAKSIYWYDYRADLNRDNSVSITDRTLVRDFLTKFTLDIVTGQRVPVLEQGDF